MTITATDGTITGTAQLTVRSGPTLKSIAVTPNGEYRCEWDAAVQGHGDIFGQFDEGRDDAIDMDVVEHGSCDRGSGDGAGNGRWSGRSCNNHGYGRGNFRHAQLTVSNVPFT